MKKYILFALLTFSCLAFNSCNQYRSLTSATKVAQLSGNPFMYNLSKSILKNTVHYLIQQKIQHTIGKINLLTPLSSIITNPGQVDGYKNMLNAAYNIPTDKLTKSYNTLSNVRDLISFVAKNGRSFNFYKN